MKPKITVTYYFYEHSMSFSGWRYKYIREDGVGGCFSEDLLETYKEIYDVTFKLNTPFEAHSFIEFLGIALFFSMISLAIIYIMVLIAIYLP